jgi:hypothetical protein
MAREFGHGGGGAKSSMTFAIKYATAWAGVIVMALLKAIEPDDDR